MTAPQQFEDRLLHELRHVVADAPGAGRHAGPPTPATRASRSPAPGWHRRRAPPSPSS